MVRYVLLLRKKQEELWENPGGKHKPHFPPGTTHSPVPNRPLLSLLASRLGGFDLLPAGDFEKWEVKKLPLAQIVKARREEERPQRELEAFLSICSTLGALLEALSSSDSKALAYSVSMSKRFLSSARWCSVSFSGGFFESQSSTLSSSNAMGRAASASSLVGSFSKPNGRSSLG